MNKFLLKLSHPILDLADDLLDERIDHLEFMEKDRGKDFNYQDEVNLYFTIKIAQLIKRIEELERRTT